jgi:hypothetical protein
VNAEAVRTAPETVDMLEVIQALFRLPSQQRLQVYDFVLFLQGKYGQAVDERDNWTDEDLVDLREASLQYIDATIYADENDEA